MKIITPVVNNPNFIEIQYYTLKKYVIGDYEFIVFNDCKKFEDFTNNYDTSLYNIIKNTCKQLNIKCIDIPNNHHKLTECGCTRCADSLNYMFSYQQNNPDKYLILDSDMFLIDYFYVNEYSRFDTAFVLQTRDTINYMWSGLVYFNMNKIKNPELLTWNHIQGVLDVGGLTENWLKVQNNNQYIPKVEELRYNKKNYDNNLHYIRHLWSGTWNDNEIPKNIKKNKELIQFFKEDPRNINNNYYCEIYDNKFLHYRGGGNWNREGLNFHLELSNKLKNILIQN
jgi:hypothetical protein